MIRSFIPPINTHAFLTQTKYTQPWMLQPVSIFSIYGLAVVLVLCNFVLAQGLMLVLDRKGFPGIEFTLHSRSVNNWLWTGGGILAGWVNLSLILLAGAPEKPTMIRTAAVQHNFPAPGHQDTSDSQPLRLQAFSEQARTAAREGAQLIVMPELGLGFDSQVEFTSEITALAQETGSYLLAGYGLDDPRGWPNEMAMISPESEFLDVYGKNKPTSPGEPRIITAGVYPIYHIPAGRLATIICNDVHYTQPARTLARAGAQLIAVPTLETAGIALEQVAQAVLRAVFNRVAVVKADGAYAAAVIDPYGRILALRNG